jgi:ATP-binding cassette subfamily C protein CydC
MQNMVLRGMFPVCVNLLLFAVCCVGAFAMSPAFGLWTLVVIGCVVLIFPAVRVCVSRKSARGLRCALKELYQQASDGTSGIRDWQLSGREADFRAQLGSSLEDVIKAARKRENIAHYFGIASQVAFALFELGLFAFAVTKFFPGAQGTIANLADNQGFAYAPNWIAAFVLLAFPLFEHFSAVGDAACDFDLRRVSLVELSKLEDNASGATVPSAKLDVEQADGCDIKPMAVVSLCNVDFAFAGAHDMLFKGINLEVAQGEWVAIVGRSGVGKTSLARLILGELSPLQGELLVYGNDPRIVKNIAVVEQAPHIFDTTLRENILVANGKADDKQIKQALYAVGLEDLLKREGGLDAKLVLDGANVSGGQRQRIALARALISELPVVLLDEPFAAVDSELEAQLIKTMKSVFANKTLICITHHKENLQAFDRVIKLT